MIKRVLLTVCLLLTGFSAYYWYSHHPPKQRPAAAKIPVKIVKAEPFVKLQLKATAARAFCKARKLSGGVCFLIDMSLPSGRKRFFVYDLQKDTILTAGLVAHGSCHTQYLEAARFSNTVESGCSAAGKYKVGSAYGGRFGKSYKLYGLQASNAHAFERFIVLHPYGCVPDEETYPHPICNSLGCPMVSYHFLETLQPFIDHSKKPVLLWIFE